MASVNDVRTLGLLVGLVALTLTACEDEAPLLGDASATVAKDGGTSDGSSSDATSASGDAAEAGAASAVIDCFKGTPKTHEELLNACWGDTVVGVSKTAVLPGGYTVGSPLPPPP
jgi:hypothetical protein